MVRVNIFSVAMVAATVWASAASATTTVNATYLRILPTPLQIRGTFSGGPAATESNILLDIGRFELRQTGGTSLTDLLGGTATDIFVAFCVEPQQFVQTNQTYNLVPLSDGANSLGGIGRTKALQIAELFGRFAPTGGFSAAMTSLQAGAFQVAIWEIAQESAQNSLNLASGNIFFQQSSNSAVFNLAQSWLSQLDGSGPLAQGIRSLRNGDAGVNSGSQDLLVFTDLAGAVPEPSSWAMLIAGFGLVGATMRRRRTTAIA